MKPETLGEVNILFQNLSEKLDTHMEKSQQGYTEIMQCIKELNNTCDLTLQQALKTNGRVNIIEPLALDYQETRARVRGGVFIVALVGASALTIGGFALNSYLNYKTSEISESVYQKLETEYDIQYEKNNQTNKKDKTNS